MVARYTINHNNPLFILVSKVQPSIRCRLSNSTLCSMICPRSSQEQLSRARLTLASVIFFSVVELDCCEVSEQSR